MNSYRVLVTQNPEEDATESFVVSDNIDAVLSYVARTNDDTVPAQEVNVKLHQGGLLLASETPSPFTNKYRPVASP